MLNYEKDTYKSQTLSQQFEDDSHHGNDINMRDFEFLPSIEIKIKSKTKETYKFT